MAARVMGSAAPAGGKPLRRDAELNLARILAAARDVFAEHGYEASMEQIAAHAHVGVGTLYRRFPTKADLFDAVVNAAKERTRQIAEEVLAEVAPGDAVFEFVRRCIEVPSCWRATISRPPWSKRDGAAMMAQMSPLWQELLRRSQGAGTVREDVVFTDLVVTLMSIRAVADLYDGHAPNASRRFLELALDGLRPGHPSPAHPPMNTEQLAEVLTGR